MLPNSAPLGAPPWSALTGANGTTFHHCLSHQDCTKQHQPRAELQNPWARSDWLFLLCSITWHWSFLEMHGPHLPSWRPEAAQGLLDPWKRWCCETTSGYSDPVFVVWKPQRLDVPSWLNARFTEQTYRLHGRAEDFVDNQEGLKP